MAREPTHHDELLRDAQKLEEAIAWARESRAPTWHLAIAATRLIHARRYTDALRVYDAILPHRTLDLSAYCNALWVVQRDNTGLAIDPERARRYLDACLIHAPANPEIHMNASGVLMELGDEEGALDQLFHAVYREVAVTEVLAAALIAPLRRRARWAELEALVNGRLTFGAMLERAGVPDAPDAELEGRALAKRVSAEQTFAALLESLDCADPRLRQEAVRHVCWWIHEPEYDWSSPNPEWLSAWHRELVPLVQSISLDTLFDRVEADLAGPWAHTAMHSFNIICRSAAWDTGFAAELAGLAPRLAELARADDHSLRARLCDGLFWVSGNEANRGPLVEHLLEPLAENVETLASFLSLSDMEADLREQIRSSVKVLDDLGELPRVRPALARMVANARGEASDRYLRDTLAALVEKSGG